MATSPHVLVVDDNCLGRIIAARMLNYFNIQVTTVASAEEALYFLDGENDVDLILTNYDMFDGMSGYELLLEVKYSPRLNDIPVVLVFIDEGDEVVEMCLEGGANGYIYKPMRFIHVALLVSFLL